MLICGFIKHILFAMIQITDLMRHKYISIMNSSRFTNSISYVMEQIYFSSDFDDYFPNDSSWKLLQMLLQAFFVAFTVFFQ